MGMTPEQRKGWSGTTETVQVKADNEQGFAVINAEDFDEKVHERYKAPRAATVSYADMTKAQLQAVLTGKEVAFDDRATKADLVALCEAL